jgi:hypothetical protein
VSRWKSAGILPEGFKHHWLISQKLMAKFPALKPLGNQLWNLKSFSSQASHMRLAHGQTYNGIEGATKLGQLYYGTPTWFHLATISVGGRIIIN